MHQREEDELTVLRRSFLALIGLAALASACAYHGAPDAYVTDQGVAYVGYQTTKYSTGVRTAWEDISINEAQDRAEDALGTSFQLPKLPASELMPIRVNVETDIPQSVVESGRSREATFHYFLHPAFDNKGRVIMPDLKVVDCSPDLELVVRFPAPEPAVAGRLATESVKGIAVGQRIVYEAGQSFGSGTSFDSDYSWVSEGVQYNLNLAVQPECLHIFSRDDMLVIIESTASAQ